MRRLVANAAIKSTMAAYGIQVTELAKKLGKRRTYLSYKLSEPLDVKWERKVNAAISEIIKESE